MEAMARFMRGSRLGSNEMPLPDTPREYLLRLTNPVQGSIDQMHERQRRHPRMVKKDSSKTKLWQVFDDARWQGEGKNLLYVYDFGDNWEHSITVEGGTDLKDNKFVCLSGEGHPVAGDVSSYQGWEKLKEGYRVERPNKEQKEKMEWYEKVAINGDQRGLGEGRVDEWDVDKVDRDLENLAERFEGMADSTNRNAAPAGMDRDPRAEMVRQAMMSDLGSRVHDMWQH